MNTDHQQARQALGARLRALRTETGLNGKEFAERLGWQRSKVSRLENGRQGATDTDIQAWARAAEQPEQTEELKRSLRSLQTTYRSWRRQLGAGHRTVQESHLAQEAQAATIHIFESGVIPGIFQTPDYARAVLTDVSHRLGTARDIEAGVRARMKRQEALYTPGHQFHVLIWQAALHVKRCPPQAMTAQLNRLSGFIGQDNITLGIIPLAAHTPFSPKHGFWIIDERLVIADTWNAELRLNTTDDITLYRTLWEQMRKCAVYDHHAHRLITHARTTLNPA